MYKITRVGVDLAKNVLQVHAVDQAGATVVNKPLKRDQFLAWCSQNMPSGCLIAIESTSGAHHWGRRLRAMGFAVRLISPHLVAPYRLAGKHGKNDANDAAAVCEAAARPTMRFVPIKSVAQQVVLAIHHGRELLKEQRTAHINQIRAVLTEFGLVVPISPDKLRAQLHDLLEDGSNEMNGLVRLLLQRAYQHWVGIEEQMSWCDQQIQAHLANDEKARKVQSLYGVGPIGASAVSASVVDFHQFKSGNTYLRTLLIQGAKSAVHNAHRRDDTLSKWIVQLKERVGWQKAVVALADKNARIVWAIMTKNVDYDPNYKSQKPSKSIYPPSSQDVQSKII
jgi:transposase